MAQIMVKNALSQELLDDYWISSRDFESFNRLAQPPWTFCGHDPKRCDPTASSGVIYRFRNEALTRLEEVISLVPDIVTTDPASLKSPQVRANRFLIAGQQWIGTSIGHARAPRLRIEPTQSHRTS